MHGEPTPDGSRIVCVQARTARVPLARPMAFSGREVTARDYTLVRVGTEDGLQGIGFTYVSNGGGELGTSAVRALLAPLLVGESTYLVERHWQRMYQESLVHGRKGSVMRALSAIDIALWDRNARAAGLTLAKYLGAVEGTSVPCYASGGYYAAGKGLPELRDEVTGYVEAGFRAVKIKIGRVELAEDLRRIATVRDAIGPDTLLLLDANHAWRDWPSALRAVRRLIEFDPYWLEEPFWPDDLESYARLAGEAGVAIASGELEAGRWAFHQMTEAGVSFIQPDASSCGGISEFRRIAAAAGSIGVVVSPGWMHDLHVQMAAATPSAHMVEFFPDDSVLNFRRLLTSQLSVSEGRLVLPTSPGLGFEFEPGAVDAFSVDDWA
jgi:L-alanine-DL-glutamate epimerase-like enolase superfamily enzyme